MSLADRLESLGWQRMHETTVDKRQEVSLDPVISPEHLRNVRQQHSRQAGSRPVTGSADTPNAYAAAGGLPATTLPECTCCGVTAPRPCWP